jgi:hypothetical protein
LNYFKNKEALIRGNAPLNTISFAAIDEAVSLKPESFGAANNRNYDKQKVYHETMLEIRLYEANAESPILKTKKSEASLSNNINALSAKRIKTISKQNNPGSTDSRKSKLCRRSISTASIPGYRERRLETDRSSKNLKMGNHSNSNSVIEIGRLMPKPTERKINTIAKKPKGKSPASVLPSRSVK